VGEKKKKEAEKARHTLGMQEGGISGSEGTTKHGWLESIKGLFSEGSLSPVSPGVYQKREEIGGKIECEKEKRKKEKKKHHSENRKIENRNGKRKNEFLSNHPILARIEMRFTRSITIWTGGPRDNEKLL
jgi:hypothetical protein